MGLLKLFYYDYYGGTCVPVSECVLIGQLCKDSSFLPLGMGSQGCQACHNEHLNTLIAEAPQVHRPGGWYSLRYRLRELGVEPEILHL